MKPDSFITIRISGETTFLFIQGSIDKTEHTPAIILREAVACYARAHIRRLVMDLKYVPFLDEAAATGLAQALASASCIARAVDVEITVRNMSPSIKGQLERQRLNAAFPTED
jgi:anti-anti-sigma regulatory factor